MNSNFPLQICLDPKRVPSLDVSRGATRLQLLCAGLFLCASALAQTPPKDPNIAAAVARVDRSRIEADVGHLVGFGTRHTLSDTASATRGIGAARRWLHEEAERIAARDPERWRVRSERHLIPPGPRVAREVELVNVVLELTGSDPTRQVIVSGHYDSRATDPNDAVSAAPGANDDASGVAVVLEAARACVGLTPRATILFIAFAGEEQGLLGAVAHARKAREAGQSIEAMITNDIVGGAVGSFGQRDPRRIRLFSEGVPSGPKDAAGRAMRGIVGSDNDAPSRQLARYLAARADTYLDDFAVTLIFRQDRFLRGGDHKAFNDEGFAAVRFTEPFENYDQQHQDVREEAAVQKGDLIAGLDFEFIAETARLNTAGIAELALAPRSPRQVRIMVEELTPHTELRWEPNGEADVVGYAVLLRRTHEPTWTERIEVPGRETARALLEGRSKDDWLFAVEAIDAQGHRSLAVFPTPSFRRR